MHNKILRLISSLPVILISLYYLPFLGVCLLILRLFTYREKRYLTGIILIFFAVLLLIFKFIEVFSLKIDFTLDNTFKIYNITLTDYYRRLIIIGTGQIIAIEMINKVIQTVRSKIRKYINKYENENREIREKNDLVMQEKREKAKNTSFVRCPSCGGDNILTGPTGTCKFCRRTLEAPKNGTQKNTF